MKQIRSDDANATVHGLVGAIDDDDSIENTSFSACQSLHIYIQPTLLPAGLAKADAAFNYK